MRDMEATTRTSRGLCCSEPFPGEQLTGGHLAQAPGGEFVFGPKGGPKGNWHSALGVRRSWGPDGSSPDSKLDVGFRRFLDATDLRHTAAGMRSQRGRVPMNRLQAQLGQAPGNHRPIRATIARMNRGGDASGNSGRPRPTGQDIERTTGAPDRGLGDFDPPSVESP